MGWLSGLVVGAVDTVKVAFQKGYIMAVFPLCFGHGLGAFAHQAVAVLLIDKSL